MDYSSLYFLKNVFTFTTTKINFVSLDLILAIDFFPQNIVIQLVSCFCSFFLIFLFDYHVGYLCYFDSFFIEITFYF